MSSPAFRVSVLGLALGLLAAAAPGAADEKADLKVGDPAPTFQLLDEKGRTWSSSDHVGKKWVVTR
jgi:hypothetical protein